VLEPPTRVLQLTKHRNDHTTAAPVAHVSR